MKCNNERKQKMDNSMSLFDLLPEEEAARFKPQKSTDWKWTFADYPKEKNGLKVFSCFACGGGSTMGYKLAGCEVIGCCEIDPKMNEIYIKNHHPKHNFLMDIRDFNAIPDDQLPPELFDLDVLDGSPPCTTFSMAGDREDSWGKKKKFREGQKEQTLDDLSFVFIETVKKLKPRIVIMENVEGLIRGEAFQYVQKIYKQFEEAGYKVHHWLMKGELMGIPQARHRVFFIACRKELEIDPMRINASFNYEPILYKEIKTGKGKPVTPGTRIYNLLCKANENDTALSDIVKREENKESLFNYLILNEEKVFPTITAGSAVPAMRREEKSYCTELDFIQAQTFPLDYNFGNRSLRNVQYICGMSVPHVMMKRIVQRLIAEGVFSYKGVT